MVQQITFSTSSALKLTVPKETSGSILHMWKESTRFEYAALRVSMESIEQWSSNLAPEIHFPAEFSSNTNQTHLINVFRIIRKTQVGEFDQGWS